MKSSYLLSINLWRTKNLEFILNSARRIYISFALLHNHDWHLGETFVIRSTENEVR